MLKVDDRFKWWMRSRLSDREYAQQVLCAVTELKDAVLEDTWLHAALPKEYAASHDPEAMVGFLKGHDPSADRDILAAIFGKWEDFEDLIMHYTCLLWGMYSVATLQDEENLPTLYLIAFSDTDRNEEISRVRWCDQDGNEANFFGFDKQKINIINTNLDSEVLRIITGKKMRESNP